MTKLDYLISNALARSADVRRNLNIGYVPFGIGLSQHGLVIARGLVNNASHVESLLETCEKEKTL